MPQPDLILTPFAQDAPPSAVDPIPETRAPSDPLEKATWTQGFPGLTMIPLAAGGIPPRGQDVNGVLKAISEHVAFQGGGGQYKWSAEYVAAKGGYEKGAVIQSDDGLASYVSAVDNNTDNFNSNPSSIGTSWLPYSGAVKIDSAGTGLIQDGTALRVNFGTTAGTVMQGNDSRVTGALQKTAVVQSTGTSTTEVMSQKAVTDALGALGQPSMTGSATLNGTTNNTVVMPDIVTGLDLEIGDVIRIDTGAYNKLHTVESITNDGSIIVNYEHAGNRGNGLLKLPDFTGQATVTRIAKWFNAPIGLGQAWVDVSLTKNVIYTNTTGRTIVISGRFGGNKGGPTSTVKEWIEVDGVEAARSSAPGTISVGGQTYTIGGDPSLTATVPQGSTYKVATESTAPTRVPVFSRLA